MDTDERPSATQGCVYYENHTSVISGLLVAGFAACQSVLASCFLAGNRDMVQRLLKEVRSNNLRGDRAAGSVWGRGLLGLVAGLGRGGGDESGELGGCGRHGPGPPGTTRGSGLLKARARGSARARACARASTMAAHQQKNTLGIISDRRRREKGV